MKSKCMMANILLGQNNMNSFLFDPQIIPSKPKESLHRLRLLQKIRTKKNDPNLNCKKRKAETRNKKKMKLSGICVCMHFVIFWVSRLLCVKCDNSNNEEEEKNVDLSFFIFSFRVISKSQDNKQIMMSGEYSILIPSRTEFSIIQFEDLMNDNERFEFGKWNPMLDF
jgi:hypothetical protein